jgi:hypothetical protein
VKNNRLAVLGEDDQEHIEKDAEPHTSRRRKRRNVLELAKRLCVLATAGLKAPDVSEQVREVRADNAIEQLRAAGWKLSGENALAVWTLRQSELVRPLSESRVNELRSQGVHENAARALVALPQFVELECRELAFQLGCLMTIGMCNVSPSPRYARLDALSGKVVPCGAVLGPCHDILEQVVFPEKHPGIDISRFARCQVCDAFFYKPRRTSRACSKTCEDKLVQREYYQRKKQREGQRRQEALRLHAEGKRSTYEIARIVGVTRKRVEQYIQQERASAQARALR